MEGELLDMRQVQNAFAAASEAGSQELKRTTLQQDKPWPATFPPCARMVPGTEQHTASKPKGKNPNPVEINRDDIKKKKKRLLN